MQAQQGDVAHVAAYLEAAERADLAEVNRLGALIDQAGEADARAETARLEHPGALAEAAAYYASRGVAVFPLQPGGKAPATAHGLHDATADLARVQAWWRATPQANIGLPTGITFDVVDLDGTDGLRSWFSLVGAPAVLARARTARAGGWHHFIAPTGRGNRAGMAPGMDHRGRGGYVVAAPSRVVVDKGRWAGCSRRYRWVDPLPALMDLTAAA